MEAKLDCTTLPAPEPKAFVLNVNQAIALPPGWQLQDVEKFLPIPRRLRASVKVKTLTDFIAYVGKFKRPSSIVFVTPGLSQLASGGTLATAVIDYHHAPHLDPDGDDLGTWCTHTVEFQPTASPAYAMLCELDGKLLAQDAFAAALRDLARFCTSQPAADLLETVRTLTLTSRGEYASINDDISGSVRLGYDVQVAAQAGTSQRALEIPRSITFSVPVFLGDAEPRNVAAELLYRVPKQAGGQVQLGIRLPDRLWMEHALITETASGIATALELLTITGSRGPAADRG